MGLDVPDPCAMTDRPRASVVIPAYNVGRFIDEALASVAAQRWPAHEVVVVDDGSTDDTNARVRAWGSRCGPAPLTLLDGPNRGLSNSRNRGIEASSGDVVALLDGDDCFFPWHLERLLPAFEVDADIVLAFGDLMRFEDGGGELGGNLDQLRPELLRISTPSQAPGLLALGHDLRAVSLNQFRILPSSWIVSRAAFDRAGPFDPELGFGEDIDFLWRLLALGGATWHDGVTSRRRMHPGNASGPARSEWSESMLLRTVARLHVRTPEASLKESQAIERYLDDSIWVNGWLAAGRGVRRYFEWRAETAALVGRPIPVRPKQFARALLRSW